MPTHHLGGDVEGIQDIDSEPWISLESTYPGASHEIIHAIYEEGDTGHHKK
jgi:hypothetical protein